MVAQLLRAAGLKVGLFSSPYIMRFNERIQDDHGDIADEELTAIMQEIAPIVERLDEELPDGGPTEFETLTALMFVYFAKHPVDVVVLEVGVGGTWDTTNIVTDKLATVITTIGFDHMAVLGNTLAEIAGQKAGILRPGVPLIAGRLPHEARKVIQETAALEEVPVKWLGDDFSVAPATDQPQWGERLTYRGEQTFANVYLDLMGDYQFDNAAVALATVETVLPIFHNTLTPTMVAQALGEVTWPVRMEKLAESPLIILDGAHNQPGVAALVETLTSRFKTGTIHVLFSALTDKNYADMVKQLVAVPNVVLHVVGFKAPTSRMDIDPFEVVKTLDLPGVSAAASWQEGYDFIKKNIQNTDTILFTGSLYFVAEVRQSLKKLLKVGDET
jgi:dihydrofolate synthase/folylpolyglutamate synthase